VAGAGKKIYTKWKILFWLKLLFNYANTARDITQKCVPLSEVSVSVIESRRWVGFFWGSMDAFYVGFVVVAGLNRGVTPFFSDFDSALSNMERCGGGLEILVWIGLIAQLSIAVSSVLLCWGRRAGVYLAFAQLPFRLFFVIPSLSLILLLPDISAWLWLCVLAACEGTKGWSLWWLWRIAPAHQ